MESTRRDIEFIDAALKVDRELLAEARAQFTEIAESLAFIPPGSAFWDSMRASSLRLRVGGWSFLYRIDGRALSVYDVRPP